MPEERRLRRRIPVSNRKFRPAQPSPWPRRRTPSATGQLSKKPSRPIEILQRCNSEPTLRTDDDNRNLTTPPDSVLFRPMTCTDVFSSADYLPLLQSPQKFEGYSKESKVVVNVIVEGSPGPIRTMVKLGSSVEETIRLVVNKYSEEGRSPLLHKNSASTFELYHSHFSLECNFSSVYLLFGYQENEEKILKKINTENIFTENCLCLAIKKNAMEIICLVEPFRKFQK
ncbi:hypothetical protein HYC85_026664 [Camellia sinensis]|uniref:DUF7054 domain-containing protein n=1 Tax=Camellia sinensis TaxID=4442 RepID=A0A7J7G5F3_CAMSI|nr:hypothetical protein HYC85_026664 [Camellia sinensis]